MVSYSSFWDVFLKKAVNKIGLYQGVPSTEKNWLNTKKGPLGSFCTVLKLKDSAAHVEITFQEKTKEESKNKFDPLFNSRLKIEHFFGEALEWEDDLDKKRCKIKSKPIVFNHNDQTTWDNAVDLLLERMSKFMQAIEQKQLGIINTAVSDHQRPLVEGYTPTESDYEYALRQLGRPGEDISIYKVENQIEDNLGKTALKPGWRRSERKLNDEKD